VAIFRCGASCRNCQTGLIGQAAKADPRSTPFGNQLPRRTTFNMIFGAPAESACFNIRSNLISPWTDGSGKCIRLSRKRSIEAIRNACLHSAATRLDVKLNYSGNLVLRVRDNGEGFEPETVLKGKTGHFGVLGMYERASRIHSKLTHTSSFGAGTVVELVVLSKIAFEHPNPLEAPWRG
jgi:hypothetical protein